uniref:G-protein coupled receptors family 2 profile 2 domain-containing protein n=1 Tax=Biomphalaria glabrata TaxID=6526 RepID=A0A2C9L5I2_BIOGL
MISFIQFQEWLKTVNVEYNITADVFNFTSRLQDALLRHSFPCFIRLDARLQGPVNVSRDEFESLVLDNWVNRQVTLKERRRLTFALQTLEATSRKSDFVSMKESSPAGFESTYTNSKNYTNQFDEDLLIEMNNLLRCGHVVFNKSEYELNILDNPLPSDFKVTIDLKVIKVTLSEPQDLNYLLIEESGELKVCWETLETKLKEIQDAEDTLRQRRLELPEGKNNMMLSLSLLLAQTSLLAAFYIQYKGDICTCLGISTHFLWLWMFSWTFICSLDMFLVFTAKTRSSCCQDDYKSFTKRCLFSVSFPATVVSAVVVVTYFQSESQRIGYGSSRCFLDSFIVKMVSFTGPLIALVLCNTIFFITSVVKIHKVRQLKLSYLNKEEQSNLIVYVKLSAMTGVFWLLATVAQASGVYYLKFIVEPINGLQGVYIFMSYVCNRRVLRLYRGTDDVKTVTTNTSSATSKEVGNKMFI